MSVTKGLVAAAGWSMDATFQRDRQVKARPCAADDDESAGESQGTTREQTEEKRDAQCAAIWRRSVGRNSRQGSLGKKRKRKLVVGRNKNNDSPDGRLSAQQANKQCAMRCGKQPIGVF